MSMQYEWKIAWRFLSNGRIQSLLIVLGIAIGVAVQFFLSSLIIGLQASLISKTVGAAPHLTILPADITPKAFSQATTGPRSYSLPVFIEKDDILSWQRYFTYFKKFSQLTAVSPVCTGVAFIERGGASKSVIVKGMLPEEGFTIYKIKEKLIAGAADLAGDNVLVSKAMAERLALNLGDRFVLKNATGITIVSIVSGIFDPGAASADNLVFTNLDRARSFFQIQGVSALEIQINDVFQANAFVEKEGHTFPRIKLESWQSRNKELLIALKSQSSSSQTIQFFILLSVTLGIASVLGLAAIQKSRQLGILKAMGSTDRSASRIFLYQGFILGIAGATAGLVLGLGLAQLFMATAGKSTGLRFDFSKSTLLTPYLLAIAASSLAAVLPAKQAAKLSPIEVIKNG